MRIAAPAIGTAPHACLSREMRDIREAYMRRLICLSFCVGLLIASSNAAAAADVSTWRWQVSQCLRAQQERDVDAAKVYREASAFEVTPGMQQRSDPASSADPLYSGDLKAAARAQSAGQ
jgi:hypothetical protein